MNDESWVLCPDCGSHKVRVTAIPSGDAPEVQVSCLSCRASVSSLTDDNRRAMRKWLACPSCGTHDINFEVSLPFGFVNWTCDDCLYDPGRPQSQDDAGIWRPE